MTHLILNKKKTPVIDGFVKKSEITAGWTTALLIYGFFLQPVLFQFAIFLLGAMCFDAGFSEYVMRQDGPFYWLSFSDWCITSTPTWLTEHCALLFFFFSLLRNNNQFIYSLQWWSNCHHLSPRFPNINTAITIIKMLITHMHWL